LNNATAGILNTTPVFGISGSLLLGGMISSGAGSVPTEPSSLSAPTENAVQGDIAFKKDGSGDGGNVTTEGDVTSDGDVVAGTVSLKTHVHTGGDNGNNTGTPVA
jgi:hypothetical protein